ncbi:DUF6103 family protein [Desulfosporosinus metallidurans]|uniref:Uncharacterized protein n=1 Tax=Desulfosporosinus metallidurans TaxID=1888891 RepID=A0A1Q8QRX5_9FIRM|nr:DUF6103 family protein [Desulfosporosinus metallidurans]OLN30104.1 hypothetical protein DSOL_3236 [Desulfosporosinus metallidurans]
MKKAMIQIKFDEERLNAIKQYMSKKDASLDTELDDVMQKLYEKHVPAPVREYIENRDSEEQEKQKRPTRPSTSSAANNSSSPA